MKNHIILISLIVILVFLFSSAATAGSRQNFNLYNFIETGAEYLVEYRLSKMSLAEKVGQLFQVGFHSKTADQEIKDLIENYHIGGVIYFSRNIKNAKQTAELSKELQQLALNSETAIPLFISADQE